jgi:hypothetical protein
MASTGDKEAGENGIGNRLGKSSAEAENWRQIGLWSNRCQGFVNPSVVDNGRRDNFGNNKGSDENGKEHGN